MTLQEILQLIGNQTSQGGLRPSTEGGGPSGQFPISPFPPQQQAQGQGQPQPRSGGMGIGNILKPSTGGSSFGMGSMGK